MVRRNQEHYVEEAWRQVGDVLAANRLRRRAEFSLAATTRLYERWIKKIDAGDLLTATAPVHPKVGVVAGETIVGRLRDSPLPPAMVSVELRRFARARGALSQGSGWQDAVGVRALTAVSGRAEALLAAGAARLRGSDRTAQQGLELRAGQGDPRPARHRRRRRHDTRHRGSTAGRGDLAGDVHAPTRRRRSTGDSPRYRWTSTGRCPRSGWCRRRPSSRWHHHHLCARPTGRRTAPAHRSTTTCWCTCRGRATPGSTVSTLRGTPGRRASEPDQPDGRQ